MTAKKRRTRTSLALAVLNLLDERPMHPYEMQQLIRERGLDQVIRLAGGSLYDTVERLVAAGLVEPVETSREGRRPERTTYRITEAGQDEFLAWLREMLSQPSREYPQFGAALAMISHLPPEDVVQLLQYRAAALEAEAAASDSMLQSMTRIGIPRLYGVEGEYLRDMRRAEYEWVRSLVEDIKTGRLTWPKEVEALWSARQSREGGTES